MTEDRQTDEVHIAWLKLSDSGISYSEIARLYGVSFGRVRYTILKIESEYQASEAV